MVRIAVAANRLATVEPTDDPRPETAALLGPLLVAPQELDGVACRAFDLDLAAGSNGAAGVDDAARRLEAELAGSWRDGDGAPLVAWRRGQRWVASCSAVRLEEALEQSTPLRAGGTYLITGGLGRVGQVVAEHLARTVAARLVLVGRSTRPPREEWPRHAADPASPWAATAARLLRLEALGAELLVASADVADLAAMTRVVEAAEARFGRIDGVVHAAGLPRDETLRPVLELDREETARQLRPKVDGVRVLDAIFRDRDRRPDFLVAMASIASVLGGAGLLAYTAGSLYQDAFVRRARRRGLPWLSVDWDGWRAIDANSDDATNSDAAGALAMSPAEAGSALRRILAAAELGPVVVSAGDLERRMRRWVSPGVMRAATPATSASAASPVVQATRPRPPLETPCTAPRTPTESKLVDLCRAVLGFAEVGVHDSFVELGGNSLQAIQLLTRAREHFAVEVPVREFFAAPTLEQLAAIVDAKRAEQAALPDAMERIAGLLDEIEALPPADLAVATEPAAGAAAGMRIEHGGEP